MSRDYEAQLNTPILHRLGHASARTFNHAKCADLLSLLAPRGPASDLTLLDLGCGVGISEEFLAPHFKKIIAVDPSPEMLETARSKNIPGVTWMQNETTRIDLPNSSVDVALAMCIFHHATLEQTPPLLAEAYRVLKPGGLLMIYEHNPLNPLTRMIVARCPIDDDMHWVYPSAMQRTLRPIGFQSIQTRYLFFFPRSLKMLLPLEPALDAIPFGAQYALSAVKPE